MDTRTYCSSTDAEHIRRVRIDDHKDEQAINMTAAGGTRTHDGGESPLCLKVFAGMGYLFGELGISLWYDSYKQDRKLKDE